MDRLNKFVLFAVAALLLLLWPALAWAAGEAASPPAQWMPLLATALGLGSLVLRRLNVFWRLGIPAPWNDAVNVFLTSALGALVPLLDQGGFQWPGSLYTALAAGLAAALALLMPAPKSELVAAPAQAPTPEVKP